MSLRINNTVTPYSSSAAVLAQHTVTISWLRYSLSLSLCSCSWSCVSEKYPVNSWVAHMSVTCSVTWWKKNLKHYSTKTFLEFENEGLKLLKLTLEWTKLIKWKYLNDLSNLKLRKIGIWIRSIEFFEEMKPGWLSKVVQCSSHVHRGRSFQLGKRFRAWTKTLLCHEWPLRSNILLNSVAPEEDNKISFHNIRYSRVIITHILHFAE